MFHAQKLIKKEWNEKFFLLRLTFFKHIKVFLFLNEELSQNREHYCYKMHEAPFWTFPLINAACKNEKAERNIMRCKRVPSTFFSLSTFGNNLLNFAQNESAGEFRLKFNLILLALRGDGALRVKWRKLLSTSYWERTF